MLLVLNIFAKILIFAKIYIFAKFFAKIFVKMIRKFRENDNKNGRNFAKINYFRMSFENFAKMILRKFGNPSQQLKHNMKRNNDMIFKSFSFISITIFKNYNLFLFEVVWCLIARIHRYFYKYWFCYLEYTGTDLGGSKVPKEPPGLHRGLLKGWGDGLIWGL